MNLYEWGEKLGLPLIAVILGWIGGRWKRKGERNESAKGTVEMNEMLVNTNDDLFTKVGELQSLLMEITVDSKKLKLELIELKGSLEKERRMSAELKRRIEVLEGDG